MSKEHPITPPPELVAQWRNSPEYITGLQPMSMVSLTTDKLQDIATQAARWGADQELEACCEWIGSEGLAGYTSRELRAARRPKPPSLKEQALAVLDDASNRIDAAHENIIRRALEHLDD